MTSAMRALSKRNPGHKIVTRARSGFKHEMNMFLLQLSTFLSWLSVCVWPADRAGVQDSLGVDRCFAGGAGSSIPLAPALFIFWPTSSSHLRPHSVKTMPPNRLHLLHLRSLPPFLLILRRFDQPIHEFARASASRTLQPQLLLP